MWHHIRIVTYLLDNRTLGPGAESLLKVLTSPSLSPEEQVDITKSVREMNIADWALIIRAFDNWPFAPEVCRCSLRGINRA